MKKLLAVILAAVMSAAVFGGCSKEEAPAEDTYNGVLTKVRLGMPMNKIIQLNSGHDMYYESDTVIWCVNPDTDLMEIRSLIPAEDLFYYAEDSLITYDFKYSEKDEEHYLQSYMEEVHCKIDRETAEQYYKDKAARLKAKYTPADDSVSSTITGTEGVDLNLYYTTTMTLSSFKITFIMELTFDTVDTIEDYYATCYSIEIEELANKTPVEVENEEE